MVAFCLSVFGSRTQTSFSFGSVRSGPAADGLSHAAALPVSRTASAFRVGNVSRCTDPAPSRK